MVEITPELQAQLDAQKAQCIFCKIIAGEVPGKQVYADDLMVGLLDINPAVKGHGLLMPKEHYPIMPFLPPETFIHLFGMLPELAKAFKDAMLCTGSTVFIANGYVAGQQAQHFLVHMLAREKGDGLDKYAFSGQSVDEAKAKEAYGMLAHNLPLMMQNHFQRNPASWHDGNVERGSHLKDVQDVIYEDEKVLVEKPENQECVGHLIVYSQEEEIAFEKLSAQSSAHLFFCASFAATAVFEGLGAQGSNIILKSGVSDDNPDGSLSLHVLPRWENDGLELMWQPKPGEGLDDVAAKIKDKTFVLQESQKKKVKPKLVDLDTVQTLDEQSEDDEITAAIRRLQGK